MHQAVDGRGGRQRVLENALPLRERKVAGQHDAAAFVAFCQQREQHFHFIPALLHVTDVVDDHHVELRQELLSNVVDEVS